MKKNTKIALCGITASLSVVLMLFSYFPYLTYAIPALTGLIIMIPVVETGKKWAFGAYLSAAVLIFIFGEPESKILYISFFGYYPILKSVIEKICKPVIEWLLKLAVFNAAAVASYLILSYVFNISYDDFGKLGQYGAYIFLAAVNIAFVIYDIGFSRVAGLYMYRLHSKIKKLLARGS